MPCHIMPFSVHSYDRYRISTNIFASHCNNRFSFCFYHSLASPCVDIFTEANSIRWTVTIFNAKIEFVWLLIKLPNRFNQCDSWLLLMLFISTLSLSLNLVSNEIKTLIRSIISIKPYSQARSIAFTRFKLFVSHLFSTETANIHTHVIPTNQTNETESYINSFGGESEIGFVLDVCDFFWCWSFCNWFAMGDFWCTIHSVTLQSVKIKFSTKLNMAKSKNKIKLLFILHLQWWANLLNVSFYSSSYKCFPTAHH